MIIDNVKNLETSELKSLVIKSVEKFCLNI